MKKLMLILFIIIMPTLCLGIDFTLDGSDDLDDSYMYALDDGDDIYCTVGYTLKVTANGGELGGRRMALIKWPSIADSLSGNTVTAATLYIRYAYNTSWPTDDYFCVQGLRRAWVCSEVCYNNAETGTAWGTAGALNTSTDRYSDILDSSLIGDTLSTGYYALNVLPYLELCDGADSDVFEGFVISSYSNPDYYDIEFHSDEESDDKAPYIEVTYTTAGGSGTYVKVRK